MHRTLEAGGSTDPETVLDAYRTAISVAAAIAILGLLVALSGLVRGRDPQLATATAE